LTEQELIELLADKEHSSWARWMTYLIEEKCEVIEGTDGHSHLYIPNELLDRWERQIRTPYAELSEQEKQSDRDEVAHILPIVQRYCDTKVTSKDDKQERFYLKSNDVEESWDILENNAINNDGNKEDALIARFYDGNATGSLLAEYVKVFLNEYKE
jgi:hypothetical protein